MLASLIAFARGLARRRTIHRELDDELQFHLTQEIAANVARGLSPTEARRVALRDLGGLTQTREAVHQVRTLRLESLWRDLRYALRTLSRTPSFTVVAVTVLTLSIGASTAIYSVVDAVILRGLPFDQADRIVAVGEVSPTSPFDSMKVAPQTFLDWRGQQDVFAAVAAINDAAISLKPDARGEPETLRSQMVTAEFFSVLRAMPVMGQPFTADHEVDTRARVAVISYGLWQRRFGGSSDIIGTRLPGQLADFEIVGVMPRRFAYPVGAAQPTEVWVPYVFTSDQRVRGHSFGYNLQVIGRLRDGVSIAQAQQRMDQISAGIRAVAPAWYRPVRVRPLHEFLSGPVRSWMLMLLGAVAFVMLLACVNLASLMLVRASGRGRELRLRAALGASGWELAQGLLVESLLLSLVGAALGLGVAWGGVALLRSAMPAEVPRVATIAIDLRILAMTTLVALITGVTCGLGPVLQFSRSVGGRALNQNQRVHTASVAAQRLRGSLIIAEFALAVVLLVGAGLFLASFARVTHVDLGLNPQDVLTVRVRPLVGPAELAMARLRNRDALLRVLQLVRALPGVRAAALVGGGLPLRGDLVTEDFDIPGRTLPTDTDIDANQISPDYFTVLRVPLLSGRAFTNADAEGGQPVVMLNQAAARKYFGDDDAVGRVVRLNGLRTVVGVVGNIRHDGPEADWRTQAFIPIMQSRVLGATLVIRTASSQPALLPAVKSAIWQEFPAVPIPDAATLEHYVADLIAQRTFNMLLLGIFGVLGILIAGVGMYGVMAYAVSQRTQEIGIRMALGAVPASVLWSVLGQASVYLVLGTAVGVPCAWILGRFVQGFLFNVQPHEPAVYAGVFAVLMITGLAAALIPARRAAHVDPLVALRTE